MPSSFLNKIVAPFHKKSKSQSNAGEQTFTIQPHPATTNNPADLGKGDGVQGSAGQVPLAPGPVILGQDMMNQIDKPATREELKARSAELNK